MKQLLKELIYAYKETWRILAGKRKMFMLILLPSAVVTTAAPLIIPVMLKQIFDAVESGKGEIILMSVSKSTGLFIIFLILVFFMNVYADAWATRLSFYITKDIYLKFYKMAVLEVIAKYRKEEVFNRIRSGCSCIIALWIQLVNFISNMTSIFILLLMSYFISPYFFVVAFILALSEIIRAAYGFGKNKILMKDIQESEENRLENLHFLVYEYKFLSITDSRDFACRIYNDTRKRKFEQEYKQVHLNVCLTALIDILSIFYYILTGQVLIKLKRDNKVSLGGVSASTSIFNNLQKKSSDFANVATNLPNVIVPIKRMFNFLNDNQPHINKDTVAKDINTAVNVSHLSYSIKNKVIINDISLSITRGEKIAVIGKNGCGKSTLIKLLAGLYEPQNGQIELFGKDISYYIVNDKRSNVISYIPSQSQLYSKEIVFDNINMGAFSEKNNYTNEVTKKMCIDNKTILSSLPDNISGGQSQRANISRALMNTETSLLLADEPTSSLDMELSKKILEVIIDAKETVLFITHNPALALRADRILYMEDGCIKDDFLASTAKSNKNYIEWVGRNLVKN